MERETPLFKKKGYYRISDPILRTWFHLVEPVQELLDLERYDEALERIMTRVEELAASVWEDLVRDCLLRSLAPQGYSVAGRLLHKGEELDVAVLDPLGKRAVVAEAKWSHVTIRRAERLRRTALEKAYRLLPRDYHVEKVLLAVKSIEGGRPP